MSDSNTLLICADDFVAAERYAITNSMRALHFMPRSLAGHFTGKRRGIAHFSGLRSISPCASFIAGADVQSSLY